MADFRKGDSRQRCQIGGLQHHGIASRKCWRDLPGQHQEREIPGDDLTANTDGRETMELVFHHFGPSGVMVKVAGDEWNVDITGFANRLAVVHRFQNGKEALALLYMTGNGIEVAGTRMTDSFDHFPKAARAALIA